jgi:hypothetical protein
VTYLTRSTSLPGAIASCGANEISIACCVLSRSWRAGRAVSRSQAKHQRQQRRRIEHCGSRQVRCCCPCSDYTTARTHRVFNLLNDEVLHLSELALDHGDLTPAAVLVRCSCDGGDVTVHLSGSVVIQKTIVLGKGTTLTIQGASDNATLDGARKIRLFQVPANASLVL